MPRRISVVLDMDARKYIESALSVDAATESADQRMKALGKQADAAGRDLVELSVKAEVAKKQIDDLGDEAVQTAAQVEGLDKRIKATKLSIGQLATEFARTGEAQTKKDIQTAERALRELEKTRRLVLAYAGSDSVERAAALAAAGVTEVVDKGIKSGLLSGFDRATLIRYAISAVAALSPFIGAAVAGAVVGIAGTGGLVGGILSATKDPRVRGAFTNFAAEISEEFFSGGSAFVEPIEKSLKILQADFKSLDLGDAFAKAAPFLPRLAEGLGDLVTNALPGFNHVMDQAGPYIDAFADGLGDIGSSFSNFLDDLTSSPGTLEGFRDGLDLIAASIRGLGGTLHFLSDTYHLLKQIGAVDLVKGLGQDIAETVGVIDKLINGASDVLRKWDYTLRDAEITNYKDSAALRKQAYGASTYSLARKPVPDSLVAPPGAGRQPVYGGVADAAAELASKVMFGTTAMTNQYRAAVDLKSAMEQLGHAYEDATAGAHTLWESNIDVAQGFADLQQRVKDGAVGWDLNTQKGRDNQRMLDQQIQKLEQQRTAALAQSDGTKESTDKINAYYDSQLKELQKLAVQLGATKKQADALAQTYTIKFNVVIGGGGSLSQLDLLNAHSKQAVTGHAAGTSYAPPGTYLAGEHGPELIYSASATSVMNAAETRTYMGGAGTGGGTVRHVVDFQVNGRSIKTLLIDDAKNRGLADEVVRVAYP